MLARDFFLVAFVLCFFAKTKAGIVLGWRLRDETVSFPRAAEWWAEVRVVSISDLSVCSQLVSSRAHESFPRALSLHECDKTYVILEKVIYIQKYKFASLFGNTVSKTQFTVLGIALSLSGFPRVTGHPRGRDAP